MLLREREEHLHSGRGDLLVHMSDVDELLDPEAILGRALPACHTPVLRMLVYGERCWSGEQWNRNFLHHSPSTLAPTSSPPLAVTLTLPSFPASLLH